jgi:hypothetical protein
MNQQVPLYFVLIFLACFSTTLFGQIDSTNLPLLIIDTFGREIVDEPKIDADLKIIYAEPHYNHPGDTGNIYDGKIGIEIRGRYSASLPQKPYGIETRNALGENLNVPLFHMPDENDWILLANYNDKTFMRNSLTFELFRKMGHYAPQTQFCEVVVNTFYQGIYVFTEKIKRDKGRVDIAKLNPDEISGDDLTGGYIIKVDYYDDSNSWTSSYKPGRHPDKNVHFVYEYPAADELAPEQKQYIRDFIHDFETLLYAAKYSHHRISKFIDIPSFIDYFILNELARNVDAYKKSSFFYKDKDSDGGLLHMGPVWDFDWAWKNINECFFGAQDGSGWAYKVHDCDVWPVPPGWMNRLLRDPVYAQKLSNRYFSLRESYLSEDHIFNYIDSMAQVLDAAQIRHFDRWRILGINVGAPETDAQPNTYAGEIDKFKNWITSRLRWLDANMPSIVVTDVEESNQHKTIQLFPNPAMTHITLHAAQAIRQVEIFSLNGKSLHARKGLDGNSIEMDIGTIQGGVFLIKVIFSDGTSRTEKLVKME